RLVRLQDGLQEPVEIGEGLPVFLVQLLLECRIPLLAVLLEELRASLPEVPLQRTAYKGVPLADEVQVGRIELLRLDQNLLPDADLAEVVQEAGVPDLPDLLAREPDGLVRALYGAVHHGGEGNRVVGHAAGVTEGGRVPLLDGLNGCADESFEQPLDLLIQPAVFDGDRR